MGRRARASGIQKIVVTPTEGGWTFSGDGNLAGMVSGNRVSRAAPQAPRARRRPGAAGAPLDLPLASAVQHGAAGGAQEPPVGLGARRCRDAKYDVLRERPDHLPLRPAR